VQRVAAVLHDELRSASRLLTARANSRFAAFLERFEDHFDVAGLGAILPAVALMLRSACAG
jgi:hypothetical protein